MSTVSKCNLLLNGRENFGGVEGAEMKSQQEELHKLKEVLSLVKEDLKKAYETKAGLFVCVCVCTYSFCILSKYVHQYIVFPGMLPTGQSFSGTMDDFSV